MLSELAFELAARGHDVKIITSQLTYERAAGRLPARETVNGVDVIRVWTTGFGRARLALRALDYATFYLSASWALWRHVRRGDIVIAKTDPPMLSVLANPIARWKGAGQINWLQDVFPEVATALGLASGRLRRISFAVMRRLRNRSLRKATLNVAIGQRMAEHVIGQGAAQARTIVIANWADGTLIRPLSPDDNALRREWGLEKAFVVGYSGNLGRAHDMTTLLAAMVELEKRAAWTQPTAAKSHAHASAGQPAPTAQGSTQPSADTARPIRWLFIGSGAAMEHLVREVEARGLRSVMFRPYQERAKLAESLSVPDVHLVSLRPALEGLIVPSKFYGIAAAGRPSIFIGDKRGEIADLLAQANCGYTVTEGDGAQLAALIGDLASNPGRCRELGRNARAAFDRGHHTADAVLAWEAALLRVKAEIDHA